MAELSAIIALAETIMIAITHILRAVETASDKIDSAESIEQRRAQLGREADALLADIRKAYERGAQGRKDGT